MELEDPGGVALLLVGVGELGCRVEIPRTGWPFTVQCKQITEE